MKRKLVQAGSSLAVTLPAEVVHAFSLEKAPVLRARRSVAGHVISNLI